MERTSTESEGSVHRGMQSLWLTLMIVPAIDIGYLCIMFSWPSDHVAVRAALSLWTGYFLLCLGSCFHETAHHTLFRSRRLNEIWGRIIGTVMFTPYTVYRESHIRHHAYLNKPDDWELWPYSDPQASLGFRRLFAWFDLLAGAIVAPVIYGRIYFHPNSPITSPAARRTIRNEYLAAGAVGLMWVVLGTLAWVNAWLTPDTILWLLAPATVYGILQTMRKFTEHLGMQSYDPLQGTRTVVGDGWLTRLAGFLNFDIIVHGPHHRYPKAAHETLRLKMARHKATRPEVRFPEFRSYLSAIRHMLPSLVANPGVGMNAGAPAPARAATSAGTELVDGDNVELLSSPQTPQEQAA